MNNKKNILVLGSSGQVGSHLVYFLKKFNYKVYTFDIAENKKYDLRKQSNYLKSLIKKSNFVFFLAFDVGGSKYLSKYQHTFEFINNNTKIMSNTFSLLNKYKKPFIFASSQMSNMSYSPYGILKAVGEQYTKALNGKTVKFWNVYGVEHDMEKSHVITDFILKAKNTGIIDMMTDGQEEREFLYADDCCEALVTVMNNYDQLDHNRDLCITSFNSTKIIDVAKIIAEKYSAEIYPSLSKDSVQMNRKNIADKYILNFWTPKTNIEAGILKVIEAMND